MNPKLLSIIFLSVMSLTVSCSANNENIRVYFPDDSIELPENRIFINLNQALIKGNTLYENDQAYFIDVGRVVEGNKIDDCSGCGKFSKLNNVCLDKDCEKDKRTRRGENRGRARRPGRRD